MFCDFSLAIVIDSSLKLSQIPSWYQPTFDQGQSMNIAHVLLYPEGLINLSDICPWLYITSESSRHFDHALWHFAYYYVRSVQNSALWPDFFPVTLAIVHYISHSTRPSLLIQPD